MAQLWAWAPHITSPTCTPKDLQHSSHESLSMPPPQSSKLQTETEAKGKGMRKLIRNNVVSLLCCFLYSLKRHDQQNWAPCPTSSWSANFLDIWWCQPGKHTDLCPNSWQLVNPRQEKAKKSLVGVSEEIQSNGGWVQFTTGSCHRCVALFLWADNGGGSSQYTWGLVVGHQAVGCQGPNTKLVTNGQVVAPQGTLQHVPHW